MYTKRDVIAIYVADSGRLCHFGTVRPIVKVQSLHSQSPPRVAHTLYGVILDMELKWTSSTVCRATGYAAFEGSLGHSSIIACCLLHT